MPDMRSDEPEARELGRLVFGDGNSTERRRVARSRC
jgi:hypothetical protein